MLENSKNLAFGFFLQPFFKVVAALLDMTAQSVIVAVEGTVQPEVKRRERAVIAEFL